MSNGTSVLVTGAGGFIGHHLVRFLKQQGCWVRGVDLKPPAFEPSPADDFVFLDMRSRRQALHAMQGIDHVYALAADMGGMGYISKHHARILRNNLLINVNTLDAAKKVRAQRLLFSSSACVYPTARQEQANLQPLREEEAYPADPQDAYGWEKLSTERLCRHYREDFGLQTHIVRFHNIYGPLGSWKGGREKAPAALCRKIAIAKLTNNPIVEIWGDGRQTRSFCYVDDAIEGITRLMQTDQGEPLNLGQDRLIAIDELTDLIAGIAQVAIEKKYVEGPQGVRGRNSDNARLRAVLNWEPPTSLEAGLTRTYAWIEAQVADALRTRARKRVGVSQT